MSKEKRTCIADNARGMAAASSCPLDEVAESSHAQVLRVASDHGASRRLAQLGIVADAIIEVRRSAPLGGPILVEVQGSTVALGRGLARKVLVRMLPPAGSQP